MLYKILNYLGFYTIRISASWGLNTNLSHFSIWTPTDMDPQAA
jgi:hypothetical protein